MAVISNDLIINDDLEIENGDLKIDVSDNQNVYAILIAHKGQFYESPLIGVGFDDYQNSPSISRELKKTIKEELAKDNYVAKNLDFIEDVDNFTLNILPEKIK